VLFSSFEKKKTWLKQTNITLTPLHGGKEKSQGIKGLLKTKFLKMLDHSERNALALGNLNEHDTHHEIIHSRGD